MMGINTVENLRQASPSGGIAFGLLPPSCGWGVNTFILLSVPHIYVLYFQHITCCHGNQMRFSKVDTVIKMHP